MLEPFDRVVLAGLAFAAVQVAPQGLDHDVADQRALARARDAGDADQRTQRNVDVDVLQVVMPCALDPQKLLADGPRFLGHRNRLFAGQVAARETARCAGNLFGRALAHDFTAAHPRPRPEVDQVVGGAHRVFVVLDHNDGVAQVAKLRERVEQAVVVARMQADRRFVENVQHTHQSAADLAGQADALRLAAREGRRRSVEREVLEPDVAQKAQPPADLFQHFGRDQRARGVEIERTKEVHRVADGQGGTPRAASGAAARKISRAWL